MRDGVGCWVFVCGEDLVVVVGVDVVVFVFGVVRVVIGLLWFIFC